MTEPGNRSLQPAMNLSELLERVENDSECLRELIDIFKHDLPRHISALREAIAEENLEKVETLSHGLKGSLATMAAGRAAAAAGKIEQLGRAGNAMALKGAFRLLENEITEVVKELETCTTKVPL